MAKLLSRKQTNDIVKQHGVLLPNGQVFITKPIKVFKKVHYRNNFEFDAIASLIIPVGALVNLAQTKDCKMRASEVYCWSIRSLYKPKEHIAEAYSGKDASFKYASEEWHWKDKSNSEVKAELQFTIDGLSKWDWRDNFISEKSKENNQFCLTQEECAEGIHFFLELKRAKDW